MKYRLYWILLLTITLCSIQLNVIAQSYNSIKNYKAIFAIATSSSKKFLAIRSFEDGKTGYLLLVDPSTLTTSVEQRSNYRLSKINFDQLLLTFGQTVYVKALNLAGKNSLPLQDAGLDQALPKEKGITLTIDLCPSHKPLDSVLFSDLIAAFKNIENPVPLALSVSGRWLFKHENDLAWLKALEKQRALQITWINHTYHHEVNQLPLAQNFLLSKNTNLTVEVLDNEQLMLKNGLVPSVFFRFPGLISDQDIVDRILRYGLIPVGSDAWLAKGQTPKAGSIVLVHANGNEELGISDFIKLLKENQPLIKEKQWLLFDLRDGLEKDLN